MQVSWRSSIWSKAIAAGFIFLICLGNIWFVQALVGTTAPPWLQLLFGANLLWIFVGAIGLGWSCLFPRRAPELDEHSS